MIAEVKDFGERIFVQGLPHGPIVRLMELSVDEQVRALSDLLELNQDQLVGPMRATITRIRAPSQLMAA